MSEAPRASVIQLASSVVARWPGAAGRFERRNHRGDVVTLLEGPVVALSCAAGAVAAPGNWARAGVTAVLGAAAFGALDDFAETEGDRAAGARGLRGHLAALRRGRMTTGVWKVLGIGATGASAAMTIKVPRRPAEVAESAVAAAVVAGSANLLNLFDLRPGRALKVTMLSAAGLQFGPSCPGARPLSAAVLGASVLVLRDDLAGRSMLGDTGANALGALLGVAALARFGPRSRLVLLVVIVALTGLSERVSFTRVIEATPGLRQLDGWGRG